MKMRELVDFVLNLLQDNLFHSIISLCIFASLGIQLQFVRIHGQMCYVETQCIDNRMTCAKRYPDDTYKSCVCNSLHYWDESLQECLQSLNISMMLASQQQQSDNKGMIEKEANEIFAGAVAAGILVIVLGVIFAAGCAIYGCCEWSVTKSFNYIKGNVSAWLFNPPEASKVDPPVKQRLKQSTAKDPENPPPSEVAAPPPPPPAGKDKDWKTVVSTVPVQAAVFSQMASPNGTF